MERRDERARLQREWHALERAQEQLARRDRRWRIAALAGAALSAAVGFTSAALSEEVGRAVRLAAVIAALALALAALVFIRFNRRRGRAIDRRLDEIEARAAELAQSPKRWGPKING